MPIIDQIRDEYMRLWADDLEPKRLRMTHDAFATLRKAVEGDEAFMLAGPERLTFMGLPIYREPNGSIDDPCWQIMTDHG